MTSRLIDVVSVFQIKLSKENFMCLVFLPFGKMLSKKKHVADNFLLKFQDEDKRFVNIYHFGIEPMGFQTALALELLSKTIINPDCCEGKYPRVNVVNELVNKLFEACGREEKQNNLQIVTTYSNHYACAYTKFSRDSLKCASCGLYPCQYCHHLPYILAEIIHKPIWKCINNGANNMYQLGLQVKKKKAEGGEFISPMLNISKEHTPICVQFYINTVIQRIVCIPLINCLYTSMYTNSKCFLKAFENCKNHERLPTLHILAAKKVHEKTKNKAVKWEKHLTHPCIKVLNFLQELELFLHK